MTFIYTRADLKSRVNANISGKIGMLTDADETMNSAVREVVSQMDFRSAKREVALAPDLFADIDTYNAPTDLAANKIIDIPAQAKRQDGEFFLVPTSEFDIKHEKGMLAIDNINGVRYLKINSRVNSNSIIASELDSLTSGASDGSNWLAFGDAENLDNDADDYIKGGGSIKFGISSAGGTTAGITHASIDPLDMTDYFGGTSSFFVYARINSTTGLTNYKIRFGSDSSNYYEQTVTTQADGTAFVSGWNLLRFQVSSLTQVGTPDVTDIKYFALYMTKLGSKVSETDYKFDWLILERGVKHDVKYYSKYGWQNSSGTWLENSTDDSDLLVADADEFEIIVKKASEKAAWEVREFDMSGAMESKYSVARREYHMTSPSEAKVMSYEYHKF